MNLSCAIRRIPDFGTAGERITGEILDYIEYAKSKGCSMTGPEDPKIEHINILTDGGKPHGIMV